MYYFKSMHCFTREAWSKLGDTSKEEAMESYVYELKEVIFYKNELLSLAFLITSIFLSILSIIYSVTL